MIQGFAFYELLNVKKMGTVQAPVHTAHHPLNTPQLFSQSLYNAPACKRLISKTFFPHEVVSLIEATFTSKDQVKMICDLRGDDAQTFIDVIHEVRSVLLHFRPRSDHLTRFGSFVSNFHLPLIRLWISRISHHGSRRSVYVLYAGYAATRLCFRNHCKSHYVTIDWIPRCIMVGMLMCGRVNMKAAVLQ